MLNTLNKIIMFTVVLIPLILPFSGKIFSNRDNEKGYLNGYVTGIIIAGILIKIFG